MSVKGYIVMDHFKFLVIAAALFLAGCDNAEPVKETQPEAPAAEAPAPAEAKAPVKEEAAAPAKAPAEEPKPQTTAEDTTTVTNNACLAAARAETNESDVTVVSNEFSEANTIVMLGVGASRAPWKCLVSNDGKVEEIFFAGDDGDGVAEPAQDVQPAATNSDGTDIEASSAYDLGCAAGTEDANNNMSMAYERHSGKYDSQYEDTFRAGFEKCWMENRQ